MIMLLQAVKRDGRRYMNPVPTKVGGFSVMFKVGPRFFLDAAARSPDGLRGGHARRGAVDEPLAQARAIALDEVEQFFRVFNLQQSKFDGSA